MYVTGLPLSAIEGQAGVCDGTTTVCNRRSGRQVYVMGLPLSAIEGQAGRCM